MSFAVSFQSNCIPFAALVILLLNARENIPHTGPGRIFRRIAITTMILLVADTAAWSIDGLLFSGAAALSWVLNYLYFILTCCLPAMWFVYVYERLYGRLRDNRLLFTLMLIPLSVLAGLLVSTAFSGVLFTVDESNVYHRGPMFFLHYIIAIFYLAAASVLALRQRRREILRDKKTECTYLALFMMFPFAGSIIQTFNYGLEPTWPLMALSMILVYINMQHNLISVDALTGLNNRRRLDQYLAGRASKGGTWFLIILDIDDFKRLNDTWGHAAGDSALRQTADALRQTFGKSNSFLARYGGDEFAVVPAADTGQDVVRLIGELGHIMSRCALSISAGWAPYDPARGLEALLNEADRRMYENKTARKKGR